MARQPRPQRMDPKPIPAQPTPPLPRRTPPSENLWINLACNAAWPALVLTMLSKEERLGPMRSLVLALAVPLAYGIYDLGRRRRWNMFSIVGVISTLLTGGLGLLKVGGFGFAVKEAAVPLVLGAAIPLSLRTRQPLVKALIYNDQILDVTRIQGVLEVRNRVPDFERLLRRASWIVASSFLLSAVLNFFLALWILKSPPGTPEFSKELGRLTGLSYPVILLPSMAVMLYGTWQLLIGLEQLTGLSGDDLFRAKRRGPQRPAEATRD